jgi:glycosyltransferase involved in cell wall biosynthesis
MPRVAVICDFSEERWHSMDLVADMLLGQFAQLPPSEIEAIRVQPKLRRIASPWFSGALQSKAWNFDRLLNRTVLYPNYLRKLNTKYDVFHIVDHSYSQLVRHIDQNRAVITCHDLDAFRSVIDPLAEPRPAWFRWFSQYLLTAFERAAHVVCVSHTVRSEALRYGIVREDRSSVAYNGVSLSCSADPSPVADQTANSLLPFPPSTPLLLHVGSTIPRKRIELLLRVFQAVNRQIPAKLVRVGGPLSAEQASLATELNVLPHVVELPFLDRDVLAAVYRRCDMLLVTSDREGFGLPLAEAMACGCPVVATDLPVLREVGASSAEYVNSADPSTWSDMITKLLTEKAERKEAWALRRAEGVRTASRFTWANTARDLVKVYKTIA